MTQWFRGGLSFNSGKGRTAAQLCRQELAAEQSHSSAGPVEPHLTGRAATLLRNALWALFRSQPLSHGLSVPTKAGLGLWDDAAAAQHFLTLQPYSLGIPLLHPFAKDTFLL